MSLCTPQGPVDCEIAVEVQELADRTAIVTGASNGLGAAYARALDTVGINVIVADVNEKAGIRLASELKSGKFVQCDVAKWSDQVRLFEKAAAFSPSGRIDYVVANAGVASPETIFTYNDEGPVEPDMRILDINLRGALFTAKLALHYFTKQNGITQSTKQTDGCLVLIGSGAAFLDVPRSTQYCATKWGVRGIMHSMRGVLHHCGSRVNIISPWYVRTSILSPAAFEDIKGLGIDFAEAEDGGRCLLRILSDRSINGHSFFLVPRKWASSGFMDLDLEECTGNAFLQEVQELQVRNAPPEAGLFL